MSKLKELEGLRTFEILEQLEAVREHWAENGPVKRDEIQKYRNMADAAELHRDKEKFIELSNQARADFKNMDDERRLAEKRLKDELYKNQSHGELSKARKQADARFAAALDEAIQAFEEALELEAVIVRIGDELEKHYGRKRAPIVPFLGRAILTGTLADRVREFFPKAAAGYFTMKGENLPRGEKYQ